MFSSFFFQFTFLLICVSIFLVVLIFLILYRKQTRRHRLRHLLNTNTREQIESLNSELEPAGFCYDLKQDIFYSLMYCWQREYGYCRLYDEASAPLSMIMDCEPIPFDYDGKKWLIEFWKGQYGMNTGGEIGIYNTTQDSLQVPGIFNGILYHSIDDSERLYMSYSLRKNGELLFTRSDLHWWLTGFKLGEFSEPSDLTMDIRITFPNRMMCNAFVEALRQAGYSYEEVLIRYHTVFFTFDKPRTPQPSSRTSITEYLVQKNNSLYCETYQYVTRDYSRTLDKLEYLKIYSPKIYSTVIKVGTNQELFRHFNLLKSYEDNRG